MHNELNILQIGLATLMFVAMVLVVATLSHMAFQKLKSIWDNKSLINTQKGDTRVIFTNGVVHENPYETHLQTLDFAKKMSEKYNIGFTYTLIK